MRDFEHEFRVRHMIKLEQNYRSHGHILDSANHLIAHNARRLGKNLRTDAGHGEPVRVFQAGSDGQEASWLVEEIRDLIAQGMSRSEIAILYRSNAQSRVIEHALFSSGIPYRSVCGGLALLRARRSRSTRWLTCNCWRTRATTPPSAAW
ncbi:3'-5' exonuclease [Cupriavidus basilensis]